MSFTGTKEGCIRWLEAQDGERFEVRAKRKARSLTANAYYWTLLNKLARRLGMPDSEVHLDMLREWGVSETFSVRSDVPLGSYFRYYDVLYGGGGGGHVTVRAYKRSSQMDSAEFSRLLSGMVEECGAQGIETMTPREVAALEFAEGK